VEECLLNLGVARTVQDPCPKKTMMMKPKVRTIPSKADGKFRVSSATSKKALMALSVDG
jgi:hypothetical protein